MNAETITLCIMSIVVLPPVLGMFKLLGVYMMYMQFIAIIWLCCMATTVQPEPWHLGNDYAVLLGGLATGIFLYTKRGGK